MLVFLLLRSSITYCELKDKREGAPEVRVPILLYHRFGPVASDSMTVTTAVFKSHLEYLKKKGFTSNSSQTVGRLLSAEGGPSTAAVCGDRS